MAGEARSRLAPFPPFPSPSLSLSLSRARAREREREEAQNHALLQLTGDFRHGRSATLAPVPVTEPPLKGFQILMIICAILFLSLLLLGLGCSYMCLKRRNVRVVHRHPFESGTGSEITKLSGSSLSNITMFEGLKIPRAHALLHATAASTSGSEANLVIDHSDTLPSDYPSESHSEVRPDNCPTRRMIA